MHTDTRAKHSCLYTLIRNSHSYYKHFFNLARSRNGRNGMNLQSEWPSVSVHTSSLVHTDTRAKHSCLYTLIRNGHSYYKYFFNFVTLCRAKHSCLYTLIRNGHSCYKYFFNLARSCKEVVPNLLKIWNNYSKHKFLVPCQLAII